METEEKKKKHAHVNPFDINNLMASSAFGANALGFPSFMPFHPMLPMLPTSMSSLHSSEKVNISSTNGSENEKSQANESVEWWKSYQDKAQNELADHLFPNPFLSSMFPPLWNPPLTPSFIPKLEPLTPSRPSSRPVSTSTTNSKQPSPSYKLSRNFTHLNGSRTRTDSESSSILSPHTLRPPSSNAIPIKHPETASPSSTFTAASFSSPTNIDNTSRDDIFSPSMNPFLFPFGAMSAYSAFGGMPMPFPASSMLNGSLPPFMLPMMPDFTSTNLIESNESKRSPGIRDSPFSHKSHNSRKSEQNSDLLSNITQINDVRENDFDKQNSLFDNSTSASFSNRTKDVTKIKKSDKILLKDSFRSTSDQEKLISTDKSKPKTNKNSTQSNINAKINSNNGNTSRETSEALSISEDGAIDLSMKKTHTNLTKQNKTSRSSQRQSKIADTNPADFLAALAHSHQAQMLASAAFPDPFNFPGLLPQLYDNMAGMFYPQNALAAIAAAAAGSNTNERKSRRGRRGKVIDSGKNNNKVGKSNLFISSMMAHMEGYEDGVQALRGNEIKDGKKKQRGKGRLFQVPEMTFHDIEKLQEMNKLDKHFSKGIPNTNSIKKEPRVQSPFKKAYHSLNEEPLKSSSQSLLPYSFNEDEVCSNTDSSDPINVQHCTNGQSEKRKSSIDPNIMNNKRKRIVHTNEQLELPLKLGWKRETKIEYITQDKVFGTVSYITPCGKLLTTLDEIKKYIDCSSNALTVNNFSFNKGRKLGKFFQCIKDRDDVLSYKEMSDEHVDALVSAIDIQRQFLLLQRINKNSKTMTSSIELSNHSKEGQNKQTKELVKINQINKGEEAKRLRNEKRSQKLADRLNRQQLSRIERDVKLIQIQEERDAKKQQINHAKEQEKERRKNYILLAKVVEARKKEEEKERLKEEKKLARKADRDKKIEQKRLEFFMAKELQKPNDDMLLNDSQILPDLQRIIGLRLPGKAFANCLTILEFVHNFASTLKIENDLLPTLSLLQGGLLNDSAVEDSFINFVKKIIKIAFEDPGFAHSRDGILQYGQKIIDVEINKDNISEIMRLFIKSRNGPNDEMVEWLKCCPFEALNATDKSSIIVFFCNEILTSKQIIADIEKNIEVIMNQRKDKWIVDGKLRKLRQQLVNRHRNNNTNRVILKEDTSTPPTTSFYSKKDSEDEQSEAESNEDVDHPESDIEDDKTISTEELESKIEKINKQLLTLNEKTNLLNHQLSIAPCGQDRFHRFYWVFPKCGGIYVEGVESSEPKLFTSCELNNDNSISSEMRLTEIKDILIVKDEEKHIKSCDSVVKVDKKEDYCCEEADGEYALDMKLIEELKSLNDIAGEKFDGTFGVSKRNEYERSYSYSNEVKSNMDNLFDIKFSKELMEDKCENKVEKLVDDKVMDNQSINDKFSKQILEDDLLNIKPVLECNEDNDEKYVSTMRDLQNIVLQTVENHMMEDKFLNKHEHMDIKRNSLMSNFLSTNDKNLNNSTQYLELPFMDDDPNNLNLNAASTANNSQDENEAVRDEISIDNLNSKMNEYIAKGQWFKMLPRKYNCTGDIKWNSKIMDLNNSSDEVLNFSDWEANMNAMIRKVKPPPIPSDMQQGWWVIKDCDSLDILLKKLNPRGIREKHLQKYFERNYDFVTQMAFNNKKNIMKLETDSEFDNHIIPTFNSNIKWDKSLQLEFEVRILREIENLEERVCSASLQGYKMSPRISNDISLKLVSSHVTDLQSSDRYVIEAAKERLLNLERNIERRYLKPPLGKSNKLSLIAMCNNSCNPKESKSETTKPEIESGSVEDTKEEDDSDSSDSDDETKTRELNAWRGAIGNATSASQLSLYMMQLLKCIAWEKSIMKVSCQICCSDDNEAQLLLCDLCDKGYHSYCVRPKLKAIPEGDWYCYECISKAAGGICCVVCGRNEARMVACDICKRNYHFECLNPPIHRMPKRWSCQSCLIEKGSSNKKKSGKNGVQSVSSPAPSISSNKLTKIETQHPNIELISTDLDLVDAVEDEVTPPPPILDRQENNFDFNLAAERMNQDRDIADSLEYQNGTDILCENNYTNLNHDSPIDNFPNHINQMNNLNYHNDSFDSDFCSHIFQNHNIVTANNGDNEISTDNYESGAVSLNSNNNDLTICRIILEEMKLHEHSWPFLTPVSTKHFPTYRKIIRYPIDFQTIGKRLKSNYYKTLEEFASDTRLVFSNCELFNEDESSVGQAGHMLLHFFECRWAELISRNN